jgi:myosin heavy subunit
VFSLGISEVQKALSEKADEIQREFVKVCEELDNTGKKLLELRGENAEELRAEQKDLRVRQQKLAEEVNLWRSRARQVRQQRGIDGLRTFLTNLLPEVDPPIRSVLKRSIELIDTPEEELAKMTSQEATVTAQTAAGRLIERARVSYDLRGSDPAERQRAAVEFTNRQGMALDEDILAELEAAIEDQDPLVKEVAILTTIQIYRYRALRSADLLLAHDAVKKLTNINHSAVIPALVEIVEKPQTGYIGEGEITEESINARSRMIALLRLVEWHTSEAQKAVQMRRFDTNKQIARAAERALELFPGDWSGPLKGKPTA